MEVMLVSVILFVFFVLFFFIYLHKKTLKTKVNEAVAFISSLNFIPSDMDMPQDVSHPLWEFLSSVMQILLLLNYSNLEGDPEDDFIESTKVHFSEGKSPVLTFCSFPKSLFL